MTLKPSGYIPRLVDQTISRRLRGFGALAGSLAGTVAVGWLFGLFYTPSTTNPQLTITSFINVTVTKGDVFDYRSASYPAYREMVQDVASRAPVQGGSYTETVRRMYFNERDTVRGGNSDRQS